MKYWKKRRQELELQKRSRKSRQRGEKLLGTASSGADDGIRQEWKIMVPLWLKMAKLTVPACVMSLPAMMPDSGAAPGSVDRFRLPSI